MASRKRRGIDSPGCRWFPRWRRRGPPLGFRVGLALGEGSVPRLPISDTHPRVIGSLGACRFDSKEGCFEEARPSTGLVHRSSILTARQSRCLELTRHKRRITGLDWWVAIAEWSLPKQVEVGIRQTGWEEGRPAIKVLAVHLPTTGAHFERVRGIAGRRQLDMDSITIPIIELY